MDYTKKTLKELKIICKERNIKGISRKNKETLINLIQQIDNKKETILKNDKINDKINIKESLIKLETKWIKWTEKSKSINFKSTIRGVGDGEKKVAAEFNTKVLGQNSPYDMDIIINGKKIQCDVKKLDTQDDFNTGVKGRNSLRYIKNKLVLLFQSINIFYKSDIFTQDERNMLSSCADISSDELAVGTIKKLNNICIMLNNKKTNLIKELPKIKFHTNLSKNMISLPLHLYYLICEETGIEFQSEFEPYIKIIKILSRMNHPYIDKPNIFMDELNGLVNIFTDIMIIIVDAQKGYMLIEDLKQIQFLRITLGNPRFKITF